VASTVREHTREIGIRVVLGATPVRIRWRTALSHPGPNARYEVVSAASSDDVSPFVNSLSQSHWVTVTFTVNVPVGGLAAASLTFTTAV
jgi:hypothetical protein